MDAKRFAFLRMNLFFKKESDQKNKIVTFFGGGGGTSVFVLIFFSVFLNFSRTDKIKNTKMTKFSTPKIGKNTPKFPDFFR